MGRIFFKKNFSWEGGHFCANCEGVAREGVGGNYLWCLFIVKLWNLEEQRGWETGDVLESPYGGGNINKQTIFLGGTIPPIFTCSPSRKNIFSTISFNNLNMCFVYILPWNLNMLYIIYHLIYFVTYFVYSFCSRVWRIYHDYLMNIFIIKKLYNLSLIKRTLFRLSDICEQVPHMKFQIIFVI